MSTDTCIPGAHTLSCPTVPTGDSSHAAFGRMRLARVMAARGTAPVLAPAALDGLAGEIIGALAPITEAAPAAMLVTLMSAYGAMCGRHAHVKVGAKPHYPNIFCLVVGATAKARKGTSAATVRPILHAADTAQGSFFPARELIGIQSGEALIQAAAESGGPPLPELSDPFAGLPVPDQRLLVHEEEYAGRMLTVAGRRDSILSAVLRSTWDGATLGNVTKKERLRAEHAHVGIVAHATAEELVLKLSNSDVANGYANRFLHVWSERSMLHPVPRELPTDAVRAFGGRLRRAVEFAHATGEVTRSDEFGRAWDTLYRTIESQPTGGRVYDNLTARATAHVLRLSLLYALLDCSSTLQVSHLQSATALWDYCEATVAHIWGATLGDADLDRLFTALAAAGQAGLDRTEVNKVFSNNRSKARLDDLEHRLVHAGLARKVKQPTGGRPREMLTLA